MILRYKRILLSLFERVRLLQAAPLDNRLVGLEIQEELIQRITAAEKIIRNAKAKQKAIKAAFSIPGTNKQKSQLLKRDLQKLQDSIEQQNLLAWIYRSIGDSIAFIYGDRWDLKQLAFKADAGFLSNKKGSRLERKMLRRAYQLGATVVMNDLTNTLRYGDITLFRPDLWPEGGSPFFLIEAKSGKGGNKERSKRQLEAMDTVSKYVHTDIREDENGTWKRVSASIESKHHLDDIDRLAKEMSKDGWAFEQVEPGLYYLLAEVSGGFQPERDLPKLFPSACPLLVISANDMKKECVGYYPFPLSFDNPELLFRFYNGEILILIFINIDSINAKTAEKNVIVSLNNDQHYPLKITAVTAGPGNTPLDSFVGYHMIGRFASEFLRLDWFIDNVVTGPLHEALINAISKPNQR